MKYSVVMLQLPMVKEASSTKIRSPEELSAMCEDMRLLAQETFHVFCIDARNKLIERQMVSMGLADATLIHPREVYRCALLASASAIMVAHNHPSGDPTPSAEDLRITQQLIEAGRIIDIKLIDHIVIGRKSGSEKGFISMREEGLVNFS